MERAHSGDMQRGGKGGVGVKSCFPDIKDETINDIISHLGCTPEQMELGGEVDCLYIKDYVRFTCTYDDVGVTIGIGYNLVL